MSKQAAKAIPENEEVIFVGTDDGHDSIKCVIRRLSETSETSKLTMPSKIVRGSRAVTLTGDSSSGGVYTADGETFTVTDALVGGETIDTRTVGYPTSPVNRILINDALLRAGLSGQDVRIVTGLPVSDYYKNGVVNKELIEAKRQNVTSKDIVPMASSPIANIVEHLVACEGVAAVFDMAINDDGSDNTEFFGLLESAPVGVIDIGGKTIDLAVVYLERGAPQVDLSRTRSIDYGMLRVQEKVREEVQMAHKLDEISPRALHRIMTERTLMMYGEVKNVEAEVATAVNKITPELFDRIRAVWGNAQDLAKVIVVGGGAYTLAKEIKAGLYPHAESRKEPEYANARGMLKMSMRNYLQNKAR